MFKVVDYEHVGNEEGQEKKGKIVAYAVWGWEEAVNIIPLFHDARA
jgi:hypothetical protein